MPAIGQAFSPGFLSLVLQKSEADADRNLKAALADREAMLAKDKLQAERDITRATLAGKGTSDRASIEAMKEQGRMQRASEANALKQALASQKEERLGAESEAKQAYYDARTGRIEMLTPAEVAAKQAETGLTMARTETQGQRTRLTEAQVAQALQDLGEAKTTAPARMKAFELANNYTEQKTAELGARLNLAEQKQAFQQAMALRDDARKTEALMQAYIQMLNKVDLFGKTLAERAGMGPQAKQAAMAAASKTLQAARRVLATESPEAYRQLVTAEAGADVPYQGGPPVVAPGGPMVEAAEGAAATPPAAPGSAQSFIDQQVRGLR